MKYAMLIDYGYCTGCLSCEISCRKEKGLSLEEWGIKVSSFGPTKLDGKWSWDYIPAISQMCDLCAERREQGQKAACELHCLANVIEIVPVDQVSKKLEEFGHGKVLTFLPAE